MDEGLQLLEPTDLYNMLQQATVYSKLTDPNYLLLLGNIIINHMSRSRKKGS